MALINCEECSAEISDKAKACPRCGNPMENQEIKINPCPQCDFELGRGAISCPNCQNKKVIKDAKTGIYRQPYKWEVKNYYSSKPNLTENIKIAPASPVGQERTKPKSDKNDNSDSIASFMGTVNTSEEPTKSNKTPIILGATFIAFIAILLFLGLNESESSQYKTNKFASYPTCNSYIAALEANEANFKKNAKTSYNARVSGKITKISQTSGIGKIGSDAGLTIDGGWAGSCQLSFYFDQNFTENKLYSMRKGQRVKAQCSSMQAGWIGGVIFTGCKIK